MYYVTQWLLRWKAILAGKAAEPLLSTERLHCKGKSLEHIKRVEGTIDHIVS
jgi:hypothetical protein